MRKNITKIIRGLKGNIIIPPDKSLSHRAIILASLANGTSVINNFSQGLDPQSTLSIFKHLGINVTYKDNSTLIITSGGKLNPPVTDLYCGNSGTTMRLLAGILSGQTFNSVLTGDISLSKRPMKRIIHPLTLMGAVIQSENNHAPLKIFGSKLNAIDYVSKLASAQVKSCILLAGLNVEGTTTYTEPYLSRNHTELMLSYMGADISVDGLTTSIKKSQLQPKEITVCGDISSAAYFIAAALIVPNSDIIIKNVGLNPTRAGIINVVKQMGGDIEVLDERIVSGEIVGDIRVKYSDLYATTISGDMIPRLIDELPIIAVLATQANGKTIIKDAEDLRNKESDRISATANELNKLGANILETKDGFIINGKSILKGGTQVESHEDHRLAMSLYVAGLICQNEITINNFEWVNISFPEFCALFNALEQ